MSRSFRKGSQGCLGKPCRQLSTTQWKHQTHAVHALLRQQFHLCDASETVADPGSETIPVALPGQLHGCEQHCLWQSRPLVVQSSLDLARAVKSR